MLAWGARVVRLGNGCATGVPRVRPQPWQESAQGRAPEPTPEASRRRGSRGTAVPRSRLGTLGGEPPQTPLFGGKPTSGSEPGLVSAGTYATHPGMRTDLRISPLDSCGSRCEPDRMGMTGEGCEPPHWPGDLRERERGEAIHSLYAPPVWVGLLATKAMMAAVWEKPRRVARGTSGCILRGDRGPLVAGWGTRLVMLEKARSRCLRQKASPASIRSLEPR